MKMVFTRPLAGQEWRNEIVIVRTRTDRDKYSIFITAISGEKTVKKTHVLPDIFAGHDKLDEIFDRLTGDRGQFKMK